MFRSAWLRAALIPGIALATGFGVFRLTDVGARAGVYAEVQANGLTTTVLVPTDEAVASVSVPDGVLMAFVLHDAQGISDEVVASAAGTLEVDVAGRPGETRTVALSAERVDRRTVRLSALEWRAPWRPGEAAFDVLNAARRDIHVALATSSVQAVLRLPDGRRASVTIGPRTYVPSLSGARR